METKMTIKQLGRNFCKVEANGKELYFSYETLIAFRDKEGNLIVCENVWSKTTGKHLNALQPDRTKRKSRQEFLRLAENM